MGWIALCLALFPGSYARIIGLLARGHCPMVKDVMVRNGCVARQSQPRVLNSNGSRSEAAAVKGGFSQHAQLAGTVRSTSAAQLNDRHGRTAFRYTYRSDTPNMSELRCNAADIQQNRDPED